MNTDKKRLVGCWPSVLTIKSKEGFYLFISFKKGWTKGPFFDLLLVFPEGQVTFPATLTLIHNPLLASRWELQFERFSQLRALLGWKCNGEPHFSWARENLPLPIPPLCFKVGFPVQIGFTPFKNKSAVWKAKDSSMLSWHWYFHFDSWR